MALYVSVQRNSFSQFRFETAWQFAERQNWLEASAKRFVFTSDMTVVMSCTQHLEIILLFCKNWNAMVTKFWLLELGNVGQLAL